LPQKKIEDVNCQKAVIDISPATAMIEIRMGTLRFIVGFFFLVCDEGS
jgi:hypothetical protein